MKQRSIVLLSLFVTVFVLTIVVGVVKTVSASQQVSAQESQVADLQQQLAEREAAYAALVEQANQQLDQANQQIEQANRQLEGGQPQSASAVQAMNLANGYSSEKASEVAQAAAGADQTLLGGPDLVDFEGTPAYEFRYEAGNIYVDLASGRVLFDGLPKAISEEQASQIAIDYLGGGKIYKVEKAVYEGADVYQLTFWAGYVVDVDMGGQIVYVKLVKYNNASVSSSGGDDGGGGSSSSHHEDDDHEDDDHEEHDD